MYSVASPRALTLVSVNYACASVYRIDCILVFLSCFFFVVNVRFVNDLIFVSITSGLGKILIK